MPNPETRLVGRIVKAIQKSCPGAWCFKVHGGPMQMVGVPDLLVCWQGRLVALEVKCPEPGEAIEHARDRATPAQRVQIDRIRNAGGTAAVVTSVSEALEHFGL